MAKSSAFASTFFCRGRSKRAIEISSFRKEATQATLCSNHSAAACQALLAADAGSVVIWGNAEFGADSSAMQTQLMLLLRSYVLVFGVDLACPEQSWWGGLPGI